MKMKITNAVFVVLMVLNFNIKTNAQAPASGKLLEAAYKQATKENKNVIIIFHASWCGWCKKMDASMNDETCTTFFEDNYVTVHLTIDENDKIKSLENPGADVFRKKYHGDKAGLPFWMIMDKKGTVLGDSFMRKDGQSLDTPGENMGCPAAEEEVAALCQLLKKTSILTDNQLSIIAVRFKKNK